MKQFTMFQENIFQDFTFVQYRKYYIEANTTFKAPLWYISMYIVSTNWMKYNWLNFKKSTLNFLGVGKVFFCRSDCFKEVRTTLPKSINIPGPIKIFSVKEIVQAHRKNILLLSCKDNAFLIMALKKEKQGRLRFQP